MRCTQAFLLILGNAKHYQVLQQSKHTEIRDIRMFGVT